MAPARNESDPGLPPLVTSAITRRASAPLAAGDQGAGPDPAASHGSLGSADVAARSNASFAAGSRVVVACWRSASPRIRSTARVLPRPCA